jgi:hypothetical protein
MFVCIYLGLMKCSNVQTNILSFVEVCKPKLNNIPSISDRSSINVIGFVDQPPLSFDLIVEPFFSSLLPLISIDSINGTTPEKLLLAKRFMNCTGTLRLMDHNKLYIDTPSTYGFSGGPCFLTSNVNQSEFIGIFTGASRLWNVCTSLQHSNIFQYYYYEITQNKKQNNLFKNDL